MGALEVTETFFISMLPVFELRGGIPYGVWRAGLHPVAAYVIAVAANILVIPLAFVFLDFAHGRLVGFMPYKFLFEHFVRRTRRRAEPNIRRWGYLGLLMLVAVPLPVTGAYTGTLAAWLLRLERRKATVAMALGVFIAGLIVSVIVATGSAAFRIFIKV